MHDCGKSDSPIVPEKSANKGIERSVLAEQREERGLAKRNSCEQNRDRTQCREDLQSELARVRQIAAKDKRAKFTSALAPRLRHRPPERALLWPQAQERERGGWRELGALRGEPGGKPPSSIRKTRAWSVSCEAGKAGVYSKARRSPKADWCA